MDILSRADFFLRYRIDSEVGCGLNCKKKERKGMMQLTCLHFNQLYHGATDDLDSGLVAKLIGMHYCWSIISGGYEFESRQERWIKIW